MTWICIAVPTQHPDQITYFVMVRLILLISHVFLHFLSAGKQRIVTAPTTEWLEHLHEDEPTMI